LKPKAIKYFFVSCLVCLSIIGIEAPLASYSNFNSENLDNELQELWSEDPTGFNIFQNRIETRLPEFKDNFVHAARNLDVHWTLLAAISYQESHWNPKAISNTGVRGMMMLTQKTAKEMGIKKRTDPIQSISGGSNYFQKTLERLPDSIPKLDRMWMTLAAYNVGYVNLNEARELTEINKKDADKWMDVIPYLHAHLENRYGEEGNKGTNKAEEVTEYVNRIRLYYETLSLIEKSKLVKVLNS